MQTIKAIIFDFYGVVCAEIGSPWYKHRPPQTLVDELKEKYDDPSNLGQITEQAFFEGIGQSVHQSESETRKEWLGAAKIDSDLVEYIKLLKNNYRIVLLTNSQPKLLHEILTKYDLKDLFDVVICSSEVYLMKPDPKIFTYTLARLNLRPDEVVFIDDREENVEAAQSLGIVSRLYQGLADVKSWIQQDIKNQP